MTREMKDSGIEWIGEIPKEWSVKKIKHNFTIYAGATPKSEKPEYWDGDISWITPADYKTEEKYVYTGRKNISIEGYESCGTTIVPKGSVIFSKRAPVGTVAICGNELCTNQGCLACVPFEAVDSIYYYYTLSAFTEQFELVSSGTTFKEISANSFANFLLPFPIYEEQVKISSFLDKKCADIDNVLEKTRASIEEYKKLKQAVITHAVTKGVRDDRKMKDSGIEWIGEIPIEWRISQVKYSLKWKSEKGQPQKRVLSLYRDYGIVPKDSRDDNHNVTSLDTSGYKVVDVGDFVINKMKAWQGSMAVSAYRGIISPAYHVCEFTNDKLNKRYFHYLMRNKSYIPEYTRLSTGMRVGQWDLGFDDFKNIPFLLPSQREQKEIVDYLDKKCSAIDDIIAKKEQYLAEIENYKKSLIYEYVTGKKEVPQEYQV